MGFIEGIIAWIIQTVLDVIQAVGLPGIFGLMTLESMCLPVPSEVVLTFGGALVSQGGLAILGNEVLDTLLVAIAGTLGCTVGSVLAYYIGLKGGRPLVLRYGRYILLNEKHLDSAERWFKKYGDAAVFTSRLLPIIRTFISLPAGMFKVDFRKFVIYTTVGSFIWCLALSYLGLYLGNNWQTVEQFYRPLEIILAVIAVVFIVWWLWKRQKDKRLKDHV